MTTPTPDISVIVAAWKAASVVERAVASALASHDVSIEVIIVDDASPDETWSVLQRLAASDRRVVIDRLAANGGPSAARNRALDLASGRFVAVLDADDAMSPDRLASLVAVADAQAADIVVDNMIEVDETGAPIGPQAFLRSDAFARGRAIDLDTWIAFNQPLKSGDCLGYLKPLIRRTALVERHGRYDPSLRNSEDYYLIAGMLANGARMIYTPEARYLYTRSSGSTSHRLKPEQTRAWLEAEERFAMRHAGRFSPTQKIALAGRTRALRNVNVLVAATAALKSNRIGAFLGLLASDIRGAMYTLAIFARVAGGKLLGRKAP